jgi:hypothetical protein
MIYSIFFLIYSNMQNFLNKDFYMYVQEDI